MFAAATTIEITDGAITWIGPSTDVRPAAREVIDADGLVAMPGLINTHCHAAMTFLRGVAEDVPIANWFNDYIWPMEVNVGGRDVYVGTMVAAAEMIESGITSFADHYFFMDEAARAVDESGMRANLGSAFFSSQGDEGLAQSVEFAETWHGRAGGRITTSIAPHAPYTCNDDDLRGAADAARRLGVQGAHPRRRGHAPDPTQRRRARHHADPGARRDRCARRRRDHRPRQRHRRCRHRAARQHIATASV